MLYTETRSDIPFVVLVLMRSTARLIAAYAWAPVVWIRHDSAPSNATVTSQATSSQPFASVTGRSST